MAAHVDWGTELQSLLPGVFLPTNCFGEIAGNTLLAADSEVYYRTLWSLKKPQLVGRWYVDVGKVWAQDLERPEF